MVANWIDTHTGMGGDKGVPAHPAPLYHLLPWTERHNPLPLDTTPAAINDCICALETFYPQNYGVHRHVDNQSYRTG